ncbi:DUF2510 domain-containing protein [Mycobacterium sp.]|uniref:DUF2510 domain-containing protein n=1 Tax=Mycobacterium sp. TaxID=1785 RepID=UPI00345BD851
MTTAGPEPGWYFDPDGGDHERFWNGEAATEHRRSRPSTFHAPRQQVSEARPHRWNCSRISCSSLSGPGRRRGWVATSASGIRCSGFGCSC